MTNGGPAFPVPMFSVGHAKYEAQQQGLSLRDYFAAKAMQALLTRKPMSGAEQAREAYIVADAMLKARGQE
jgi:hypothetical protein